MNDRKWQLKPNWRFSWHRWKQHRAFTFLTLVTLIVCLVSTPSLAKLTPVAATTNAEKALSSCDTAPASLTAIQPAVLFEQGRQCYETGALAGAEARWSAAATAYARTGDRTGEIRSRINQAQALKALGNNSLALKLLQKLDETVEAKPPFLELKAKILRSLGDVQQLVGYVEDVQPTVDKVDNVQPTVNKKASAARKTLQESLKIAQNLKPAEAISAACFSLGLVDRAEINRTQLQNHTLASVFTLQKQVELALQDFQVSAQMAPTSINTIQAELNQLSLLVGALPQFNGFLKGLSTLEDDALRLLLTRSPDQVQGTLAPSPSAVTPSTCMTDTTQADASASKQPASQTLLMVRNQTVQWTEALLDTVTRVQSQLLSLPPSRMAVDARINFAQSLIQFKPVADSALKADLHLNTLLKAAQTKQTSSNKQKPDPTQKALQKAMPKPAASPKPTRPIFLSVKVKDALQSIAATSFKSAANILGQAIDEAHALPNERSEALARITLAELYSKEAIAKQAAAQPPDKPLPELIKTWRDVETLSQKALTLATENNAPTVIYRAQRQLAQAYQKQGKIRESRASCKVGAATLQALRGDLVAIDQDIQFNFREKVESFYRECAAAFLPSGDEKRDQEAPPDLEEARKLIESLQLAEIDNFLREACIQGQKVQIDTLVEQNPKTAFIYTIVLSDRKLGVIAKIPDPSEASKEKATDNAVADTKKPEPPTLIYRQVSSGQKTIPDILATLEKQLTTRSGANEGQLNDASSQVYQWLIAPFEKQLTKGKDTGEAIHTLVFVLDEALRDIPMAALYNKDSDRYLIQDYAIAVSPGLQLLDSKPIAQEQLNVFAAGLSEKIPLEFGGPLPFVKTEFKRMVDAKIITDPLLPLLDDGFSKAAFATMLNKAPYNVVHLATHGQFSSRREENYIRAVDGTLDFNELSEILRSRSQARKEPIELLVLSACETAKGDPRATLGLAGLSLKSGIRSTLATLWSVEGDSTTLLVNTFYKVLRDPKQTEGAVKLTKARALQLAQQEILKRPFPDNTPYHWAPYVLFGNWL